MDSELSLRKAQLLSSRGLGSASLQGHPLPSASREALTPQTLLELPLPPPPLALPGLGAFMSLQRDWSVFSLEVWVCIASALLSWRVKCLRHWRRLLF